MDEILRLVGACLIAFLIGAAAALSLGGGILTVFSGDSERTQISVDELRAAYRESQAIAELAGQQNRELTGEIQELRGELERSLKESRELREQIDRIAADNHAAQNSARGLEETNRRFRELVESLEAGAD
ncbi:MAG: hypothetical protein SVR04_00270 [Spirochaetota bacterium]|jgi:uncharacterized protein (DUF3084 family)|nr:hypothetical protein [Spirochaetota bacterium]